MVSHLFNNVAQSCDDYYLSNETRGSQIGFSRRLYRYKQRIFKMPQWKNPPPQWTVVNCIQIPTLSNKESTRCYKISWTFVIEHNMRSRETTRGHNNINVPYLFELESLESASFFHISQPRSACQMKRWIINTRWNSHFLNRIFWQTALTCQLLSSSVYASRHMRQVRAGWNETHLILIYSHSECQSLIYHYVFSIYLRLPRAKHLFRTLVFVRGLKNSILSVRLQRPRITSRADFCW